MARTQPTTPNCQNDSGFGIALNSVFGSLGAVTGVILLLIAILNDVLASTQTVDAQRRVERIGINSMSAVSGVDRTSVHMAAGGNGHTHHSALATVGDTVTTGKARLTTAPSHASMQRSDEPYGGYRSERVVNTPLRQRD